MRDATFVARGNAPVPLTRGRWMWSGYVALTLLAAATVVYGPLALLLGMLAAAFGVERTVALWRSRRPVLAAGLFVWLATSVALMLLPIWSHQGFAHVDGKVRTSVHHHYLWEMDHIH